MPTCLPNCGILYDVNGACAAQDAANVNSCFCNDPRLTAFKTTTDGVCAPGVCAPEELGSIQGWYTSFCANQAQAQPTATGSAGTGNNNGGGGGGGGDW